MSKIDRIKTLVEQLNYYRNLYYNKAQSGVSDFEYDRLFDELQALEQDTGFIMANSPTQNVGYEVLSSLQKVQHNHPMLSLDKTKSVDDVLRFLGDKDGVIMAKMDGLTCSVRYLDGKLVSAETRGNGEIGEDILHCAKIIKNLPLEINCKDEVIIDGEVIITYDDFERINARLPEDQQYKHPRNLASGSIRQLDSKVAAERNMKFIAWKFIKGDSDNSFQNRWVDMTAIGFDVVPILFIPHNIATKEKIEHAIVLIKNWAKEENYPIDGCVFGYNDIAYGESLGATGHHLRSQLAYKFYDELYETTLRNVEWTMGKTSVLTPTAIFDSVEIDGTEVSRASLHNISIIKNLGLTNNCTVRVYKANQIIPKVDSAEQDGDSPIEIPKYCPICGGETKVVKDNDSEVLVCTNDNCLGKLLGKLSFFVSKKAMDIDGLSEKTLEWVIKQGWVKEYKDIYHLQQHRDTMINFSCHGEKSVDNLLNAIEKSRNVDLAHFITALSIPDVGSSTAKSMAAYCNNDVKKFISMTCGGRWERIEGIGINTSYKISNFMKDNFTEISDLANEMHFIVEEKPTIEGSPLKDLKFCITGSFSQSRDVLKSQLEARGAKFVSSVSKNLDILFVGDKASSKLAKAQQLGVRVAGEDELMKMLEK